MILIIPAAADQLQKPYIFDSDPSGKLLLYKSVQASHYHHSAISTSPY